MCFLGSSSCSNIHFQAFPAANAIFAGIGVLLSVGVLHGSLVNLFDTHISQVVRDASTSQDKVIDIFSRIELFFAGSRFTLASRRLHT